MSTIPSDLVDIRDKLSNCADTWLKESDALLQSIAKGIMADRQEIVSLKHSLKKALEENKVLKAKLRFAETSTLYTADSLDTLDSSMPLITVGEVDSSEVQTGVEMMLLFKSLLKDMNKAQECTILIEMYKLSSDPEDNLRHIADLIIEMSLAKPSFCGLYVQYCKQLASVEMSKVLADTCEHSHYKFDTILMDKLNEQLNLIVYAKMSDATNKKEDDEKDDEEVDSASQPQSTTESATQEKAKLLVVIRLIGQLYLEANRYCITKEFVLNVVRKLVADFSTVRPCDAQLPLEGLWTLMNIIGGKLREDYKGLAKSLQYMTPFLRLEQFIKGREVSEEGQQMFRDIMGQASY